MENIILWSTGCPKCRELKLYLQRAGITDYTEINDVEKILEAGFTEVPALSVGDKKMKTKEAFQWCKSLPTKNS